MKSWKLAVLSIGLLVACGMACATTTLETVQKRGHLRCGASTGVPGFSVVDSQGQWVGLDVDLCRALAAAVFNDATKFEIVSLNTQQRFTALQSGEVDVLTRNTSQTLTRDASLGLIGAGVNYYDSQGVMVRTDLGPKSARDLNGATICVQPGTTSELNLADWFHTNKLTFKPLVIEKYEEVANSLSAGRCDAFTTDKSQLAATRTRLKDPESYKILPDDFSKEPLGPMVRQDDMQWFNLVRWTLNVMIEAEEYELTSYNVEEKLKNQDPTTQRLIRVASDMGKNLGVDPKWAYSIIKQVGNYGESFERNVGNASPLKLPRGLNAQWKQGGLMYAWPIR